MMLSRRFALCLLVALACQPLKGFAAAKFEDWTTLQGEKFRGTPIDVVGPFALFRTAQKGGRKVLLRQLAEADCVRFDLRIADAPPRAVRWTHSTSEVTKGLPKYLRRLEGQTFVTPEFDALPEPEFVMFLFLSHPDDRSWQAAREFLPEYQRVRTRFGNLSEAVYVGVRHSEQQHELMARQLQMPWLIENFRRSEDGGDTEGRLFSDAPTLSIVSRTGVPIASSPCKTKADIERAVLELEAVLNLMRPGNKRAWPDRLYYYKAVRLASFTTGRADPLLIGHVLDLDGLRVAGVKAVNATLTVSADGVVTSASVQPAEGITVEFGNALGESLRQSAMVPAVENGRFVEGTYELRLEP